MELLRWQGRAPRWATIMSSSSSSPCRFRRSTKKKHGYENLENSIFLKTSHLIRPANLPRAQRNAFGVAALRLRGPLTGSNCGSTHFQSMLNNTVLPFAFYESTHLNQKKMNQTQRMNQHFALNAHKILQLDGCGRFELCRIGNSTIIRPIGKKMDWE